MKMRVLLTGASGTIGREALDLLCQNSDFEVTVFDIKTKLSQKVFKSYAERITIKYGNICNIADVEDVCKEIDFAIHLAAVIPPLADEYPELSYRINVLGTQNLISALEKHSKDAFFLYTSSVSIYGDRVINNMITVDDSTQPSEGDTYGETKVKAEKIVRESSLNWTIFRLSAIIGVDNHKISQLMFDMPLCTSMEITSPRDTGRALANAVTKSELLNKRIFNLGGGEKCRVSYNDFLSRAFDIFGLGKLNFPKKAFADKNFHCGYYADGDDLEEILHFREDCVESLFEKMKRYTKPVNVFFARLLRGGIKRYLLGKSRPYHAFKKMDKKMSLHYFNPENPQE